MQFDPHDFRIAGGLAYPARRRCQVIRMRHYHRTQPRLVFDLLQRITVAKIHRTVTRFEGERDAVGNTCALLQLTQRGAAGAHARTGRFADMRMDIDDGHHVSTYATT